MYRKHSTFRPAGNSPSSRHLTHIALLCFLFFAIIAQLTAKRNPYLLQIHHSCGNAVGEISVMLGKDQGWLIRQYYLFQLFPK